MKIAYIMMLVLLCSSCRTSRLYLQNEASSDSIEINHRLAPNSSYSFKHQTVVTMDSLIMESQDLTIGTNDPRLKAKPISQWREIRNFKIKTANDLELSNQTRFYLDEIQMDYDGSLDDLLAEVSGEDDFKTKSIERRNKRIKQVSMQVLDTIYCSILNNKSLQLDTVISKMIDQEENKADFFIQKMNRSVLVPQLLKYWNLQSEFPNGAFKLNEQFISTDISNTIESLPDMLIRKLETDTTGQSLDDRLGLICATDKQIFEQTIYTLVSVEEGIAHFDIEYVNYMYAPNLYADLMRGKGHLNYDLNANYFTSYQLEKTYWSDSNLLGNRKQSKRIDLINFELNKL